MVGEKMKLAVVGSRDFHDYAWLERCLLSCIDIASIKEVISGGARGADSLAERFAAVHGLSFSVIPADWKKYGKRAGPLRNTEIVRQADMVIAFWDGSSRGTRNTIDKALRAGKSVRIFSCGERKAEE